MMKIFLSALLLAGSSVAFAECSRPPAPQLPDGSVADLQTMVDGQGAVKAYVAETEAYLDCLGAEGEAMSAEETPEQKLARVDQHNAAVDEMEVVASAFNEEIREYKEKAQ